MPALYTPEIYKRFAAPLQLDLGPTADAVDRVEKTVDAVKVDTGAVAGVVQGLNSVSNTLDLVTQKATALGQSLNEAQRLLLDRVAASEQATSKTLGVPAVDVLTDLTAAMKAASDDVVNRVLAGQPLPKPSVGALGASLVRLLIQAQAVAFDETPDERFPKNDKNFPGWLKDDGAIVTLGAAAAKLDSALDAAPDNLRARYRLAFEKFPSNSLPDRAKRFADMHALVAEIAAFLNGA